jgi:hypothetical protein
MRKSWEAGAAIARWSKQAKAKIKRTRVERSAFFINKVHFYSFLNLGGEL